jgi:polyisoprenoid-binding protein YceI
MSLRLKLAIAAGLAFAVTAAVAGGFWFFFLRGTSPPPVSLQAALTSVAPSASPPAVSTPLPSATDLAGTWSIASGSNSFAGYRVSETLAGVGANTAVGRTQNVQGTLVFDGSSITSVQITADLTTLQSDKSQRDGQLRTQALETSRYPTARFELTMPIPVDGTPQEAVTVTKTVQGTLTLHGATRPVAIDVQGQLKNGQIVVVGSTAINFSDFSISSPHSFAVLSVDDHGVMEFQLVFGKAAG